jgi:hypothetical protein
VERDKKNERRFDMKLEDQVTNKELSENLEKLGVNQNGQWWWHSHPESDSVFIEKYDYVSNDSLSVPLFSAFTVAELGEMLPVNLTTSGRKTDSVYSCIYGTPDGMMCKESDTEADARAKMLIFLIENKLMEVTK